MTGCRGPATGIWVASDSWGNRQSRVAPPWVSKTQKIKYVRSWGYSSVAGCLPNKHKALIWCPMLKRKGNKSLTSGLPLMLLEKREKKKGICNSSKLQWKGGLWLTFLLGDVAHWISEGTQQSPFISVLAFLGFSYQWSTAVKCIKQKIPGINSGFQYLLTVHC